ncbi:MAG: HEAT repeat domain-containing protein [Bryobacteraceae bacterium]
MKSRWPVLLLLASSTLFARDRIAEIEFFGYKGIDVEAVRKARSASNICCDKQGDTFLYIGLAGQCSRTFTLNPKPTEKIQVSQELAALSQQMDEAENAAVHSGNAIEEQPSPGYRLPKDPQARKATLAIRQYALQHEDELYRVLESSSDGEQRAIAADALGFANRSERQVAALVHASRDANDDVRNNATRALGEMAMAGGAVTSQIPADAFIEMLWSGDWFDRNKASGLLMMLTASRDPKLLSRLRTEALDPLIEIARWDNDHALAARLILGRMAGISDIELVKLVYEDPGKILGMLATPAASKP